MRICQEHWEMMRQAIADAGLDGLVAQSGEVAMENVVAELHGEDASFDPLMSMHWHWTNAALEAGGLYLMGLDESGKDYCPICEFIKNVKDFDPKSEINNIASQMLDYARSNNLVSRTQ